jgi:hypothetical protein
VYLVGITRWFKYDRDWFFLKILIKKPNKKLKINLLVCKKISPGHIWTTLYMQQIENKFTHFILVIYVPCIFYYFVLWPTNAYLFHKLLQSCMFRHYCVIFKENVISTLPIYTSISNAAVCNTITNKDVSPMWNMLILW